MPIQLTMPPQDELSAFWSHYFASSDAAITENFWGNLSILKEAYQHQDAFALQLAEAGYVFDDTHGKPATFYSFVNWSFEKLTALVDNEIISEKDLLIPAKAFETDVDGQKIYHFIRFGGEIPLNATELNLLSPKIFVDMLSAGYFPIGAPIREHTNQTLCEHDMAHICGFISSPEYMKTIKEAFRRVGQLMAKNPLIEKALTNFDSLYSLRLFYMIEIFSIIPDSNIERLENLLTLKISDFSLEHAPEDIYPRIKRFLKGKEPGELYKYLHQLYSHFPEIINPVGGESRDILNRNRKFSRAKTGSLYSNVSHLTSRFDGSSIYSMYLTAMSALREKRSNHPDFQQAIEDVHASFIAALIGTSQLTIEDWIYQAIEERPNPESKLYKYICGTGVWNKSHVLYWAYGFYDPAKVLSNADFTMDNVYFSNGQPVDTVRQINDIKYQFFQQRRARFDEATETLTSPLMITRNDKYNVPYVAEVKVTPVAIQSLLQRDNTLGLPRFLDDFLNMKPSRHRETLGVRPELITWMVDNKYLLMPNPEQTNHDMLLDDPKRARSEPTGFGLIAWFIHPLILQNSPYLHRESIIQSVKDEGESLRYGKEGTKENLRQLHRVNSYSLFKQRESHQPMKQTLVEQSGKPYISGPFDYTAAQLPDLYALKEGVLCHLKEYYGVTDDDKVDLYFHTHYSIDTNTAHLHVRVNQLHHGLELDKSVSLDEIIQCLEQGKRVEEIFINRQYMHVELAKVSFLRECGYEVHEVRNPYYLDEAQPSSSEAAASSQTMQSYRLIG